MASVDSCDLVINGESVDSCGLVINGESVDSCGFTFITKPTAIHTCHLLLKPQLFTLSPFITKAPAIHILVIYS
jgi:hypothetical protein